MSGYSAGRKPLFVAGCWPGDRRLLVRVNPIHARHVREFWQIWPCGGFPGNGTHIYDLDLQACTKEQKRFDFGQWGIRFVGKRPKPWRIWFATAPALLCNSQRGSQTMQQPREQCSNDLFVRGEAQLNVTIFVWVQNAFILSFLFSLPLLISYWKNALFTWSSDWLNPGTAIRKLLRPVTGWVKTVG